MGIELRVQAPKEALAFFQGKGLLVTGSWQSIWQAEHAQAFTVANLARIDLLQEIHGALLTALNEGQDYRTFAKGLVPKLQAAGWWNQPTPEGKPLGPQRLQLIYDANLRTSYAVAKWERIQRIKKRNPFLRYSTMGDARVRPAHRTWEGITLPVDHPFWNTHYPPNGWRCRCTVTQYSQADLDAAGFQVTPDSALPTGASSFTNRITGEVSTVPLGIDPGWAYNVGVASQRASALGQQVGQALQEAPANLGSRMAQEAGESFTAPLQSRLGAMIGRAEAGALLAQGEQLVVGAFLPPVADFLAAAGLGLDTAALTLGSQEILPSLGPSAAPTSATGAAWSLDLLRTLPSLLAKPGQILWDTRDRVMLYLWPTGDRAIQAVVRVSPQAQSQGINTNLIGALGMVATDDLASSRYVPIPLG